GEALHSRHEGHPLGAGIGRRPTGRGRLRAGGPRGAACGSESAHRYTRCTRSGGLGLGVGGVAARARRSTATDQDRNRTPDDDVFRAAFENDSRKSCVRGGSAYCLIAGLVILATTPLDRVRFPELAGPLLVIRLAGITAMAAILALLRSDHGRRHPRAVGVLPPSATGALIQALAFATGGHTSPVNIDTNFAIIGVALMMPWTMAWSALSCLVLVGEYVAATATAGTFRDPRFTDNLLVLTAASGLAIVTTGVRERWRRR